jgi:DNA-directed RNA polymerase specialized sigma subunit
VPSVKDRDQELWLEWKKSPTQANLEALMKQMMPVIMREVNRWKNLAPSFLLENTAKQLALEAFKSYNPNAGTSLNTHLTWQLQKLSRVAYSNQNTLSVPEHQRLTFNQYMNAARHLEDQHGKPPTHEEIADYLAIPPKKLRKIIDNVQTRELMESGEGPPIQKMNDDDYEFIHLAYSQMTPLQRRIFELRTGYNNTPIAPNAKAIMTQLGLSQGQLSYQLNAIKDLLKKSQKLR